MQPEKSLVDAITDLLQSKDLQLPVYSRVAAKLRQLVDDPNVSAEQVEKILLHDAALASQILRVANSSFYAGLNRVGTIKTAILRLGLAQIVELGVLCAQREQYRTNDPAVGALMSQLWRHSLGTALGARWLAEKTGHRELAGEAFMAGLLHDIGELLLLKLMAEIRKANPKQELPESLVMEILATMHGEQGGRLVEHWNLPAAYAEIARSHHGADPGNTNTLGLIVRIADLTCRKLGLDLVPDPTIVLPACPEAALLGVKEVTLAELEITLEDAASSFST